MDTIESPRRSTLRRWLRFLKQQLPPWNFITIHWAYFIVTCLVSAIIIWGSSTPPRSVRFIDALFLAVSAMTEAGLNTINLSSLNTFQQFMLFLLILLGSAIFVSAFVVQVRQTAFERKFRIITEKQRGGRAASLSRRIFRSRSRGQPSSRGRQPSHTPPASKHSFPVELLADGDTEHRNNKAEGHVTAAHLFEDERREPSQTDHGIRFHEQIDSPASSSATDSRVGAPHPGIFGSQGTSTLPGSNLQPLAASKPPPNDQDNLFRHHVKHQPGLSGGWVSRNSQFHGLSAKEREQLGGYEYRAVRLLAWLVPTYYVLFQLLGALGCAAWVAHNEPESARSNGLNPWWVGAFNAISAFNNSGMSLLDANMVAYQTGYYLVITMGLLILAGNTCYPIFLRLIVWTMWKIASCFGSDQWKERASTLRFLLDHPRRCYTNLFPSLHTWWLLGAVVTLNGIDWAGFEILNIGNAPIEALPVHVRVIDGLFQAIAVRSGGFYIVNIATVRISLQVLYVVMMYISVYPVVISMRNTNVYEERSLGIYDDSHENLLALDDEAFKTHAPGWSVAGLSPRKQMDSRFVRQQLRAQLAHDIWVLVLALFVIMIIEGSQFQRDPSVFSVFNFLFEIVSGYGCVGISTGVPWNNYSFCGTWHTLSKLVLCFVMLRGRHRGLPIAIDKAVMLPGEDLLEAEENDGRIRAAQGNNGGVRRGSF